jgi:UPF0042 nucleotide-binding protein
MEQSLVVIVTGLSGSGKSTALKVIEDAGFLCIDNIPLDLLTMFIELKDFASLNVPKICFGLDVRAGAVDFVEKAPHIFEMLRGITTSSKLIFLESKKNALLNRYKESRRRHPLSEKYPNLIDAIEKEISIMEPIRAHADYVVDTSEMNVHGLQSRISDIISTLDKARELYIQASSFAFKKGLPIDADIVMDVRFLPNPHFVEGLKEKTGKDAEVKAFLNAKPEYTEFLAKWKDLIKFILPLCKKEGRSYLSVAIGCTGGRHRSVAVAEETKKIIEDEGFSCKIIHRDLE